LPLTVNKMLFGCMNLTLVLVLDEGERWLALLGVGITTVAATVALALVVADLSSMAVSLRAVFFSMIHVVWQKHCQSAVAASRALWSVRTHQSNS
jgi:hypothetical protein